MSSQNGGQSPASEQPMKPIGLQYTCASDMNMWEMLIQVATKRCEELIEESKQQNQCSEQVEATPDKGKPVSTSGDDPHCERSLIGSAEIAIGGNITLGDADDEFEDSGRLVIDEDSFVEKAFPSGLIGSTPQPKNKRQSHIQCDTEMQPSSNEGNASVAKQEKVTVASKVATEGEPSKPRMEVSPLVVRPVVVQDATSTVKRPASSRTLRATLSRHIQCPIPVTYNGNMARKFPGAENRTPQQQAVRERNTIAARVSRAKMRMLDEIMKKEQANEENHYQYMKERVAALCLYANFLRGKLKQRQTNYIEQFEHIKKDYVPRPVRTHQTRNRSQSAQDSHNAGASGSSSSSLRKSRKDPTPQKLDLSLLSTDTDTKPNSMADDSETDSVPEMEETVLDLSSKNSKQNDREATPIMDPLPVADSLRANHNISAQINLPKSTSITLLNGSS